MLATFELSAIVQRAQYIFVKSRRGANFFMFRFGMYIEE